MIQSIEKYYTTVPEHKSLTLVEQGASNIIRDSETLEKTIKEFLLGTYIENSDSHMKLSFIIPSGAYPIEINKTKKGDTFNLKAGNQEIVANSTAMNILLQLENVIRQVADLNQSK
jgi:hypothetical protein